MAIASGARVEVLELELPLDFELRPFDVVLREVEVDVWELDEVFAAAMVVCEFG